MVRRDYHYTESGLPNVILANTPLHVCTQHGVQAVILRGIDRIHGDIRRALLDRKMPLTGPEIRFLRKYNRWSQAELAARLGVHKITVAKWETGALAVSVANQQRLRSESLSAGPEPPRLGQRWHRQRRRLYQNTPRLPFSLELPDKRCYQESYPA
jgi:transcriptional regulator with XRE-family HTH domain